MKRLLINYVYYRNVGHVVEALKYAKGYFDANKNIEIYLLLNKNSPTELVKACNFIKKVYPINTEEILKKGIEADCIKTIQKKWDYIVTDERAINFSGMKKDLINFHKIIKNYFVANDYKGYTSAWYRGQQPGLFKYKKNSQVVLKLPIIDNNLKKDNKKSPKICLMLGGSGEPDNYPSIESWIKIIRAIKKEFPNSILYLTGTLKGNNERTKTWTYKSNDLKKIFSRFDNVKNKYDIGLWNQLNLIKQCDIFISPHTGFAFLVPCVGTPWLTISGGNWHEYLFNKIPFYSVIPNTKEYPAYSSKKSPGNNIKEKRIFFQMDDKSIEKKIPEINKGIKLLLRKDFTYKKAIKLHISKIKKSNVNIDAIWSFDRVLEEKGLKK